MKECVTKHAQEKTEKYQCDIILNLKASEKRPEVILKAFGFLFYCNFKTGGKVFYRLFLKIDFKILFVSVITDFFITA